MSCCVYVCLTKSKIEESIKKHTGTRGEWHIDRTFLYADSFLASSLARPHSPLSHPVWPQLAFDKKPAAIVYGVNFTSAFHTHARCSALMDFHLSPLPTHPALIIRGMRTNTRGMPGYAVEFMTSMETAAQRRYIAPCTLGWLAAISKKSAAIRRAWDNSSDYVPIRRSSASSTWTRSTRQIAILTAINRVGSILISNAVWFNGGRTGTRNDT